LLKGQQEIKVLSQKGINVMISELTALQAQVAQNTTINGSAVTLISGIAAQFAALKDDPAAISALSDQLKTSANDLSAAIAANTPAAPGNA
jgi:glutamate-1-semialdehyde aminotransferase